MNSIPNCIFSTQFIRAVGDGIREYNSNRGKYVTVRIVEGIQHPNTPEEQAVCDSNFYTAVGYGLEKAAHNCSGVEFRRNPDDIESLMVGNDTNDG